MRHYLAFDLGAESGRAMLGTLDGGRLTVEGLHRFANTPVRVLDALYWDTLRLWHEIRRGLAIAGRERKLRLDGIMALQCAQLFGPARILAIDMVPERLAR